MSVVFFRTIIIYVFLLLMLRLTGKRQIGELQPSELVTTLILSQIASQPIVDDSIPLLHGIIPVCIVVSIEVAASHVMTKCAFIKKLFIGKPSVLIDRGKIDIGEMSRVRVTVEELMAELRAKGVGDISDVYYAVMEESGSISVITKAEQSPPTRSDSNINADEKGIAWQIISDGEVNQKNLKRVGKDGFWLEKYLKSRGAKQKDVFLLTCNDAGNITFIKKGKGKK